MYKGQVEVWGAAPGGGGVFAAEKVTVAVKRLNREGLQVRIDDCLMLFRDGFTLCCELQSCLGSGRALESCFVSPG